MLATMREYIFPEALVLLLTGRIDRGIHLEDEALVSADCKYHGTTGMWRVADISGR